MLELWAAMLYELSKVFVAKFNGVLFAFPGC